jgi:ABC-type enterochelin transport system permease subunit
MKGIESVKGWVAELTELGLMLVALAIVLAVLVGSNLPFFGTVTANIMAWVKDLGSNGLVGLITLGIIFWLFSNRKLA